MVGMFGLVFALFNKRMMRANRAGSGSLFGRVDPYKLALKGTALYSRLLFIVVGGAMAVLGFLGALGVVHP